MQAGLVAQVVLQPERRTGDVRQLSPEVGRSCPIPLHSDAPSAKPAPNRKHFNVTGASHSYRTHAEHSRKHLRPNVQADPVRTQLRNGQRRRGVHSPERPRQVRATNPTPGGRRPSWRRASPNQGPASPSPQPSTAEAHAPQHNDACVGNRRRHSGDEKERRLRPHGHERADTDSKHASRDKQRYRPAWRHGRRSLPSHLHSLLAMDNRRHPTPYRTPRREIGRSGRCCQRG